MNSIVGRDAPKKEGYLILWQPLHFFEKEYANLDMLFKEEKGIGSEFLRLIDVDGWKLCLHEDFPSYPNHYGFVVDMKSRWVLCQKKEGV